MKYKKHHGETYPEDDLKRLVSPHDYTCKTFKMRKLQTFQPMTLPNLEVWKVNMKKPQVRFGSQNLRFTQQLQNEENTTLTVLTNMNVKTT